MQEVWERKPHVFKATPERKALFKNLVTIKHLQNYANDKEEAGEQRGWWARREGVCK